MITYFSLIITMLFWGGTFIAGRALAGSVPPADSAFLRFVIASLALAVLVRLVDGKIQIPPRKLLFPLFLLGATGVFSYNLCFFTGLQYIEAGRAALIIALNPLAITIAAVFVLGEKLNLKQFCGLIISLVGTLFVISNGQPGIIFTGGIGVGEAAIFGCVISWAVYSLIGRTVLNTISPVAAVFYSSIFGSILLFPLTLQNGSVGHLFTHTLKEWASLVYLGLFGTAIGFTLYYLAIRGIGASRSSVFINLVPLFSIFLAWLVLGESINPTVITGGLVLLTGVYLANSPAKKNKR